MCVEVNASVKVNAVWAPNAIEIFSRHFTFFSLYQCFTTTLHTRVDGMNVVFENHSSEIETKREIERERVFFCIVSMRKRELV